MIPRISNIHLELSSLCNASCPQCSRNNKGGAVNPDVPLVYLSRADIEAIFTPALLADLTGLKICGNYGDGGTAPDALESLRFLKARKPGLAIELHTNGGMREPGWWGQVAGTVDRCAFGIDGLADTNHLYRRGVSWPKLMRNVQAFIAAGGTAEWHYLIFRHNEHQVESARALATSLGFQRFVTKRTPRFFKGGTVIARQPVLSRTGEVEYFIEPPLQEESRNPAASELSAAVGPHGRFAGMTNYLESTSIRCKAIERKQIYISSEGLVFPCCWTASIYNTFTPQKSVHQMTDLLGGLPSGRDAINAKRVPVADIVRGPFFQKIADSWAQSRIADGRLITCAKTCGQCDLKQGQRSAEVALGSAPAHAAG